MNLVIALLLVLLVLAAIGGGVWVSGWLWILLIFAVLLAIMVAL